MHGDGASSERMALNAPVLILVTGLAGSGKTTLARKLVERVWAVLLEKDELQNPFSQSRDTQFYKQHVQRQSYDALWNLALSNLRVGNPVLVDAPLVKELLNPTWCKEMENRFACAGFPILVMHCEAPPTKIRERLTLRREKRDEAILVDFAKFLEEQPLGVPIPWLHLKVDTQEPLDTQLASVLEFLSQQLRKRDIAPSVSQTK